jgi:hypothetical protein
VNHIIRGAQIIVENLPDDRDPITHVDGLTWTGQHGETIYLDADTSVHTIKVVAGEPD